MSEKSGHDLSESGGRFLCALARSAIAAKLGLPSSAPRPPAEMDLSLRRGLFVTLKKNAELRGCIGSLQGLEPLADAVRRRAVDAACHDSRFPPLDAAEFKQITIEVSILTEARPLAFTGPDDLANRLRPGTDGVILRQGGRSATFLPQVWEQLPRPADFLSHLCLKAGLAAAAWRQPGLEVEIYEARKFSESD